MAEVRQRPADLGGIAKKDVVIISESSPTKMMDVESFRRKLRQRWELASVLNFLHVFKPVIESELSISAEDIETALIEQNNTLAQLHIALLKGIIPASQTLKSADAWVIVLSKTLSMWWPWVAQGEFPLTGGKGEEVSIYKKLEPASRLDILKALCEVRVDQYDAVDYINETIKNGTEVAYFRKNKLASDGNGITFWYDGNETFGHRLYKEVHFFGTKRGKGKGTVPEINCQWETLATNLDEFRKIVNDFSSSEVEWEVALSKSVEMDIIPVLEKQWKKKQRAQKRLEREQKLLNCFRSSVRNQSCRNHKPINYRYDDYDKAIAEAIQYTNKRTSEERREERKEKQSGKRMKPTSNGESTESDSERSIYQGYDDSDNSSDEENERDKKYDGGKDRCGNQGKVDAHEQNKPFANRSKGLRFSRRLAGTSGHSIPENTNLVAKNRLRQRPSVNTAVESTVVPDSEDEPSSGVDSEN